MFNWIDLGFNDRLNRRNREIMVGKATMTHPVKEPQNVDHGTTS